MNSAVSLIQNMIILSGMDKSDPMTTSIVKSGTDKFVDIVIDDMIMNGLDPSEMKKIKNQVLTIKHSELWKT